MQDHNTNQSIHVPFKQNATALCCPKVFADTWTDDVPINTPLALLKENDSTEIPQAPSLFTTLPEEVVRIILQWMDIPSLAQLIQTSRAACISQLASDDKTWFSLVHRRFFIATKTAGKMGSPRSKSYGDATWKGAYRSMALTNRLPKCRAMPRKNVVFAKGGNSGGMSMWVMVSHTDDCNTRIVGASNGGSSSSSSSSSNNTTDHEENNETQDRYIELRLCLQNVRSSSGPMQIDLDDASVNVIGARGLSSAKIYRPNVLYKSSDSTTASGASPRRRMKRHAAARRACSPGHTRCDSNITLKSFEYVVVSVHVPCSPGMRYETDFLSRSRQVNVPVLWSSPTLNPTRPGRHFDPCVATFMHEPDIWEHYIELPGSCLTLVDRNHVMSA